MNAVMVQTDWVTTKDLVEVLKVSRQGVYQRADREGWRYMEDGTRSRKWQFASLPTEVQGLLVRSRSKMVVTTVDPDALDMFGAVSDKSREVATYRVAWVQNCQRSGMSVKDFVAAYESGMMMPSLRPVLGQVSIATAYRWIKDFNESRGVGLIPKWGLTAKRGCQTLTDTQKQMLKAWYCDPRRWSVNHCYTILKMHFADAPSYATVNRYLTAELPSVFTDFRRLGEAAWAAKYQPHIRRNPELLAPMDQVQSDHHCWDFFIKKDGKIFRPWVTVFIDVRTRLILGWCPSVIPSSRSIIAAFYRMVCRYGAPGEVHIDNGKDYRAQIFNGKTGTVKTVTVDGMEEETAIHIQGLFGLCGTDATYAKPYHGASKGVVERMFGTMAEYFAKEFSTYAGSNTSTRPDEARLLFRPINGKAQIPVEYEWEHYVQTLDGFMEFWNKTWRGSGRGREGMTSVEAFDKFAGPPRMIDREVLALALTKAEVRTVIKNVIKLDGLQYYAEALIQYSGQKVVVRRRLDDTDAVLVTDEKGRSLCVAVSNVFEDTGDRAANNERVETARKKNLKLVREFGKDARLPDTGRGMVDFALADPTRKALPAPIPVIEEDHLPIAVGAENLANTNLKPKLISPLDVGLED